MKRLLNGLMIAGVAVLGFAASGKAQVQQSINFSLTLRDQTDTGVRLLHISNRDVIANLVGTNVPGARLWLIMPSDPSPGANGNIGAFLRVTDGQGNVLAETDSSTFNIYQTFSSQTPTGSRIFAFNQFSLDFGGLGAELYGTATWTKSPGGPGGQGSFVCSVSGHCGLGGVSNGEVPCTGSISGGPPKPAQ
jgi:hypothetical protein